MSKKHIFTPVWLLFVFKGCLLLPESKEPTSIIIKGVKK